MSIEITGPKGRPPSEIGENRRTTARDEQPAVPAPPAGGGGSSDTLKITSTAVQLKALEDQISELPAVDTKRVQEVQRSLATGSFQIDPASVADKMLQFEAGLGNGG